jgi:ribonuclease D
MDTLKPTPHARVTRKSHPMKDEIALLPAFQGLVLEEIELLETEEQFARALEAIKATGLVGFDTESKPSFQRGDVSDGPHVVQLALDDRAYIIQIGTSPPIGFLQDILGSASITKVGFGLKSDRAHLHRKFGIKLVNVVDLTGPLRILGYKQALGVKAAVAVLLGQNLPKSKSMSTSNWARNDLEPSQLLYAANDAFAALRVYQALQLRTEQGVQAKAEH